MIPDQDDVPEQIAKLEAAGVAVWLDDLSRDRLRTGSLGELIAHRGVVGVTTNPSIFAAALTSDTYETQVRELAAAGAGLDEAVVTITTDDVRAAADVLRPVFDRTGGLDGRVSIEVDPRLAHDTQGTLEAARMLWARVDRPNLFIKIPATLEGLPAITAALPEGISVNVTLIFSLGRSRDVLDAFQSGLEQARSDGHDLSSIASVASFFVSRVDTAVDGRLDALGSPEAAALRGEAAIANAILAYELFGQGLVTHRWKALAAAGARPQRPLWASTGVKDPAYPDTRYVDRLVARDVVNTMPERTLEAVADHGSVDGDSITGSFAAAHTVLDALTALGIDLDQITADLEVDGVRKFQDSWDQLLHTVGSVLEAAR
jgi:transaldolase